MTKKNRDCSDEEICGFLRADSVGESLAPNRFEALDHSSPRFLSNSHISFCDLLVKGAHIAGFSGLAGGGIENSSIEADEFVPGLARVRFDLLILQVRIHFDEGFDGLHVCVFPKNRQGG